jgi:hypothetical protein
MIPRDNAVYPDERLIRAFLEDVRELVTEMREFNEEEEDLPEDVMDNITLRWRETVESCWLRLIAKGYEVLCVTVYEITFVRRQICTTCCVWIANIFTVKISWASSGLNIAEGSWRAHYPVNRGRHRFNGYNSFPPMFEYLSEEPDWQRSGEALLSDLHTGSLRYIPYHRSRSWMIISHAPIPRPEHIIDEHDVAGIRNFLTEKENAITARHTPGDVVKPLGSLPLDEFSESVVADMSTVILAQWIRLMKTGYRVIAFSWYQMLVIDAMYVDVPNDVPVYQLTVEMNKFAVGNQFGFGEPACKGIWSVPHYVFPPPPELSLTNVTPTSLTSGTATWNFPASRSYRFPV